MATIFTTWQALYLAMLDQAAAFYGGKLQVASYDYTNGGNTQRMQYRTEKEFQDGLEYVKKQAQLEASGISATAIAPAVGRTYARNAGRG
ncbi:hypothetical protein [Trichlorobacter lovleyi]|uniref:hypothetical protein n=1 Tax=Trichlorobacter lovleyi TaxID=313985 RepID=UPI003D0FA432